MRINWPGNNQTRKIVPSLIAKAGFRFTEFPRPIRPDRFPRTLTMPPDI
jgi:hypothetical protein